MQTEDLEYSFIPYSFNNMSSSATNAFARTRPRARQQRIPRTHSWDHPRFLQLVNELARINEAKKKQEENEDSSNAGCAEDEGGGGECGGMQIVNLINTSCCNATNTQALNGYRSLDSNQSTSATHNINLHNNSVRQMQQQHSQDSQHLGNNLTHQDDRCLGKCLSSSFGYSKQNLVVEQSNSEFSNTNSDLRQDENRSKRKRSTNDSAARKTLSSCSGTNKKHKSSEEIRPLSPSFTKCPICLLDSMDRDPSFTNTCFHLFCYVCIENWTKNKATCPLCRTKFTKIIYNIKSATSYEEKVASPIRRDDEDGYLADRLMLEHLSGLNSNSTATNSRNSSDEVQFLFENLRNHEVLMPQYFVNQMDPRQGDPLHSFNSVTTATNFNTNVPHPSFAPSNYPISSSYILFPNRIPPTTSTAIASAYTGNTSLTNINTDPNSRRVSRSSSRYTYPRNYEPPNVDGTPSRVSRASSASVGQSTIPIDRHHNLAQQHQHPHQNHHQHHHQHTQHRSPVEMNLRQSQRLEQSHTHVSLPYNPIQQRHYNPYPRRSYNNPPVEHQQLLNNLYRQMPEM